MNVGAADEQTAQTRFEQTDMIFENEWEHGFDNEESLPTPVDQSDCDPASPGDIPTISNAWFQHQEPISGAPGEGGWFQQQH